MRPLFRVTVGGSVSKYGLDILYKNIRMLKRLYPECDIVVCYNNINIKDVGVKKIDQNNYLNELEQSPINEMWKFYPPRLRYESHEIIMDNDIVLFKRVPEIDRFLCSNKPLLLEAKYRVYGQFDSLIPQNLNINSGIYGLPPFYDFKFEIKELCKGRQWTHWCDDQGVVAALFFKQDYILIGLDSVVNYFPHFSHQPLSQWNGIHMMGVNQIGRIKKCDNFIPKRDTANLDIVKQILTILQ